MNAVNFIIKWILVQTSRTNDLSWGKISEYFYNKHLKEKMMFDVRSRQIDPSIY